MASSTSDINVITSYCEKFIHWKMFSTINKMMWEHKGFGNPANTQIVRKTINDIDYSLESILNAPENSKPQFNYQKLYDGLDNDGKSEVRTKFATYIKNSKIGGSNVIQIGEMGDEIFLSDMYGM